MVILKTLEQIKGIRKSCNLVSAALSILSRETKPGITTNYLDKLAEEFAYDNNAIPAFKGYKGFPYSICASVNNEIVHGMPSEKPLNNGDIISIDYGLNLDGYFGDSSVTLPVGTVSEEVKKLIQTGQECLYLGIEQAYNGNRLNKISHAIFSNAHEKNYNVIKQFVGHGIGLNLHEPPQVTNYTKTPNEGLLMQPGLVIAIEPMIVGGYNKVIIDKNGWTARTVDNSLAVHWEHTVLITGEGTEILTLRKEEEPYDQTRIKRKGTLHT